MISWVGEHIVRPSPRTTPYKLKSPGLKDYSQIGQQAVMDKYFKGKRNGKFLEVVFYIPEIWIEKAKKNPNQFSVQVGAFDGEKFSNTLVYERDYNWTGVLVEPDEKTFQTLLSKNRKCYALNVCYRCNF